jgi:hypothetical protein
MFKKLDAIVESIITNPVYLEKVYLDDPEHIIDYIYDTDHFYDLEFAVLKNELQNPKLVKKYIKRISSSNKLILMKEMFHMTKYDDIEEDKWEHISRLFCEDKWDEIVKAYMYYKSYYLVEDQKDHAYLQVISILKKIDYDRRFLPEAKKIAINKIKRNSIYNLGLGLKIAKKQYSKDFN